MEPLWSLKGFKMSVRLALRLLNDSRAREYQVEPGFATAVLTDLARFYLGTTGRGLWEDRRMLLSFAYLAFSAVLKLLVGRRRNEFANDVELMVLRHQLDVLGRQAARPSLRPADRAFLAALARVLPRPRRLALVVTPRHFCVGTASWFGASGRSRGEAAVARRSTITSGSSCCGSRARTRVGVTRGSQANS